MQAERYNLLPICVDLQLMLPALTWRAIPHDDRRGKGRVAELAAISQNMELAFGCYNLPPAC
jgi:hypothetical protein